MQDLHSWFAASGLDETHVGLGLRKQKCVSDLFVPAGAAFPGFTLPILTNILVHLKKREVWHISTNLGVGVQICVLKAAFPSYPLSASC